MLLCKKPYTVVWQRGFGKYVMGVKPILIPKMCLTRCGTISKGNKQAFQWYKIYCQEALIKEKSTKHTFS